MVRFGFVLENTDGTVVQERHERGTARDILTVVSRMKGDCARVDLFVSKTCTVTIHQQQSDGFWLVTVDGKTKRKRQAFIDLPTCQAAIRAVCARKQLSAIPRFATLDWLDAAWASADEAILAMYGTPVVRRSRG